MWELVQEASQIDLLIRHDVVPVTTSARRRDDVLVEWERNKDDDDKEIDRGANSAHTFGSTYRSASLTLQVAYQVPTNISTCLTLDMSRPLRPAFIHTLPSHLIKA